MSEQPRLGILRGAKVGMMVPMNHTVRTKSQRHCPRCAARLAVDQPWTESHCSPCQQATRSDEVLHGVSYLTCVCGEPKSHGARTCWKCRYGERGSA